MPEDVILPSKRFVYPQATATDNCTDDEDISIVVFNSLPPTNCPQETILERHFQATDLCGNSVLEVQTVTVTDNDLPYFTSVPEDQTISCNEVPVYTNALATDDCSSFEVTEIVDCNSRCVGTTSFAPSPSQTPAEHGRCDANHCRSRPHRARHLSPLINPCWNATTNGFSHVGRPDNCSDVMWNMTTRPLETLPLAPTC